MKGKCISCGKKATSEYLIISHRGTDSVPNMVSSSKFCDKCKPKYTNPNMQLIYGK